MKTEDFLSDDFLKQFKTADQLNDFLAQIQKRGIEKCWKESWIDNAKEILHYSIIQAIAFSGHTLSYLSFPKNCLILFHLILPTLGRMKDWLCLFR